MPTAEPLRWPRMYPAACDAPKDVHEYRIYHPAVTAAAVVDELGVADHRHELAGPSCGAGASPTWSKLPPPCPGIRVVPPRRRGSRRHPIGKNASPEGQGIRYLSTEVQPKPADVLDALADGRRDRKRSAS